MGFEKKIVAIILAAGRSSRMGAFKPLLDIGGRPALYRLLDSIRDAGISAAGVVAGSERESLDAAVRGYFASGSAARGNPAYGLSCRPDWDRIDRIQIDTVHNAQYARGMFSSVQAGIRYARGAG
ncbi:MAG: NTP transferase domain-containing protein, partial [Clostridiales Family XIII bacterium]|nr:NTP transferase domain-containing protein [Clostridiales Family XIII bacterium]